MQDTQKDPLDSHRAGDRNAGTAVHPDVGTEVRTACGGVAVYTPSLPWAMYRGKVVYFCMSACKADFDRDPASSCLACTMSEFD